MPTSTTVKGLNINELTEAQYDAAVQGGVIGPNELSVLTDVSYVEPSDLATVATTGDYDDLINKPTIPAAIQVSSMPTAGVDELGKIYQFVGATDASYTNGYFYKCVSDGQTPATYSWEQTDVQPAGSSLPDQTGQSGKFLTTDGTDVLWGDALVNAATNATSLSIFGSLSNYAGAVALGPSTIVYSHYGTAIGSSARAMYKGTAIGYNTIANANFSTAIGYCANANAQYAIQVGVGNNGTGHTNNDANTLKVGNANGNYELMSADGTIPEARLADTTSAQQGDVLTLDSNGDAVWQAGGGGGLQNTATGTNSLTILGTPSTAVRAINIGVGSTVTGPNATVLGQAASASGNSAVAIGISTKANNSSALALVSGTVSGIYSKGISTNISGNYSIGITTLVNHYSTMTAQYTVAIGAFDYINNFDDHSFYVGLGTSNADYKLLSADGTIPTARLTKVNSTITLTSAGWSGGSQTVTVTGMTTTGVVLVSPDPTDQSAYTSAGVYCTAQAANSLTFTCSTTPSADIDVNVVML